MNLRILVKLGALLIIGVFIKQLYSNFRYNKNHNKSVNKIREVMKKETIILGGGCFWCTESVFQMVKGVISVESGYAGGHIPNPTYKDICSGTTGYAEVVKLVFDTEKITLEEVLLIFMATHDPTTLNRQGNDVGTQYRSVIFFDSEDQKTLAERVIKDLQPHYENAIITKLTPFTNYYKAEGYHQDFYTKNPSQGYCNAVIPPKIEKLRKLFAEKLK